MSIYKVGPRSCILLESYPISWDQRNKGLFLDLPLKLSIEQWHKGLQMWLGWSRLFAEFAELGITSLNLFHLQCNNQSALSIPETLFFNEHMKHIEIDYQFITENILEGLLQFSYLPTLEQLADVFTKVLLSPQFKSPLHKLGMCDPIWN